MDQDFKEITKQNTSSITIDIPREPTLEERVRTYRLSQNEKAIQDLSDSLDKERGKNVLLKGKMKQLQKYEGKGFSVEVQFADDHLEDRACVTFEDCADLINNLLILLQEGGRVTDYSINAIQQPKYKYFQLD